MKYLLLAVMTAACACHAFELDTVSYADEFTKVDWGARPAALAGATVCAPGNVSALAVNPAGLAQAAGSRVLLMHASRFNGELAHDLAAVSFGLSPTLGVGLGFFRAAIDGIKNTNNLPLNELGRPIYDVSKLEYASATDNLFCVGLGKQVRRQWAAGATVKIFHRALGTVTGYGATVDAGALLRINGSFNAGLNVRNVTTLATTWSTGQNELAYPSVDAGISYAQPVPYFYGDISLYYQVGSALPSGNANTGSASEPAALSITSDPVKVFLGGNAAIEYVFKKTLSLRAGRNGLYDYTVGCGITLKRDALKNGYLHGIMNRLGFSECVVDYAFLQHAELLGTHLVSLTVAIEK